MALILVFISGFLFATGLGISGMTQPEKVSSFLNVMGNWDPSLILVMLGASGTYFIGQKSIAWQFPKQLALNGQIGKKQFIDKNLIVGSALFGIGWGMIGFCPGPAVVALSTGSPSVILFVVSMILGMIGYTVFARYSMGVSPKDETSIESESLDNVSQPIKQNKT